VAAQVLSAYQSQTAFARYQTPDAASNIKAYQSRNEQEWAALAATQGRAEVVGMYKRVFKTDLAPYLPRRMSRL
jgi:predicted secreted protein